MLRKIVILLMSLSLCWTTVGCGGSSSSVQEPSLNNNASVSAAPISLDDGKYPVQQATYDDVSGEYNLMLLNTPPRQASSPENRPATDGKN